MSNILFFNEIKETDFKLVGGKGFNLGKLIQNNFPVPNGFCITTTAFDKFISFLNTETIFKKLIDTSEENIHEIDKICSNIRKLIVSKPLQIDLQKDIEKALHSLGKENFFAIRSSATAEDLPGMSFAGQQDTYLNIGEEEVITHVKICFASLYTQRAVIYRKKNKIIESDVSMSVVVQKIVNSQKSGIMFTTNPLNNNYNQITIDAGFGLGESLVSGLVEADLYKYDKYKGKIIETNINKKEIAIYKKDNGKTIKVNLDEKKQKQRVLSSKEIKKLASIGKEIENYYNYPQDIEWAIDDDDIYILQSRPETSLYPKIENTNPKQNKVYFSLSHFQVMTDPIRPLGIDMFKRIFPYKQDDKTYKSSAVESAGGRVYVDLTEVLKLPVRDQIIEAISSIVDQLMGSALNNYLSENTLHKTIPSIDMIKGAKGSVYKIIKQGHKNSKLKIKPNVSHEVESFIDNYIDDINNKIKNSKNLIDKVNKIEELSPKTLLTIFTNVGPNIVPGILSYKSLTKLLEKNQIDTNLVNTLVSGLEGNVTTEMGLRVGDLTDCVRDKDDIINILKQNPSKAHQIILKKNYKELNTCLSEFLKDYGMRGIGEIDITNPRYKDDFTTISTSIINNINTLKKGEHRKHYQELIEKSKACEGEILKLLKEKESKDLEKAKNLITNIRTYLAMREHGKYALIRNLDIYRSVILECGDTLMFYKSIREREDVFYLTLDEILVGLKEKSNFKAIIENRKEEHKSYYNLNPPRVIDNNGEIYTGSYSSEDIPKGALVGTPVSSGVYEGYAKVILDPTKESLEKGEILVTKFTDPGWTPLFINAKGLILEVGGLMTHGAIVAREYGIPALVSVENASELIKTGDYLRINADSGYIEILR